MGVGVTEGSVGTRNDRFMSPGWGHVGSLSCLSLESSEDSLTVWKRTDCRTSRPELKLWRLHLLAGVSFLLSLSLSFPYLLHMSESSSYLIGLFSE